MKNISAIGIATVAFVGLVGAVYLGAVGKMEEMNTATTLLAVFCFVTFFVSTLALNAMVQQMEDVRGYVEALDRRMTDDMRDTYRYIEESKRDIYERVEEVQRGTDQEFSSVYRKMDEMDDCCTVSKK